MCDAATLQAIGTYIVTPICGAVGVVAFFWFLKS